MSLRKPPEFSNHPVKFGQATEVGLVRAVCCHISDGDTADFLMDLGWYQYAYIPLRFRGINTPELRGTRGKVRERALQAKQTVTRLLKDKPVVLRSHKQKTSFERFVGDVFLVTRHPGVKPALTLGGKQWLSICDILLSMGLADKINPSS